VRSQLNARVVRPHPLSVSPRMTVSWTDVAPDFVRDGSLRDIYVFGTGMRDWDVVLAYLRTRYQPLEFSVDGRAAALPTEAADVFALRLEATPLLRFGVGGVDVACHFFTPDQIELDLPSEQVDGPERLASVVEFLRGLAFATSKAAVLTEEGSPNLVILHADPVSGRVVHYPTMDTRAV
jgi:hypothetical protein